MTLAQGHQVPLMRIAAELRKGGAHAKAMCTQGKQEATILAAFSQALET